MQGREHGRWLQLDPGSRVFLAIDNVHHSEGGRRLSKVRQRCQESLSLIPGMAPLLSLGAGLNMPRPARGQL